MQRLVKEMLVLLLVVMTIIGISALGATTEQKRPTDEEEDNYENNIEDSQSGEEADSSEAEIIPKAKLESLTGLLIGFDYSGGLTDVLMVVNINTETNAVKVISVPRDLVIDFTTSEFKKIKADNDKNNLRYCKLNEVYSLVGWDDRALMDVKEIVSIITGLEIDYMASVDVNSFPKVVDAMGGVEFYVPEDMHYSDPAQDLYIDLKEGLQLLDGDKAEQLVRYRKYKMGDLQRIQVQQDFMIAVADQAMDIEDFGQLTALATTVYDIVDRDFGLLFALEYAEYFFNLDMNHILKKENMIIIPSYGEKVDGIWYQRWDKEATYELLEELFNEEGEAYLP